MLSLFRIFRDSWFQLRLFGNNYVYQKNNLCGSSKIVKTLKEQLMWFFSFWNTKTALRDKSVFSIQNCLLLNRVYKIVFKKLYKILF